MIQHIRNRRWLRLVAVVAAAVATNLWWQWLAPGSYDAMAGEPLIMNGFDISKALIPAEEILPGGPPRDGIPAIDHPKFIPAKDADFLGPDDRILALQIGGTAKAYPIKILNWHEIVNDHIASQAVTITYCPLCGTGVAFDAEADGRSRSFGVSGLLYNSDVLLYDRETESLWSQILGKAVSGRFMGTPLRPIPLEHTTWHDWQQRYPDTLVLSTNTGFGRDYNRNPYAGYEKSRELYFSVTHSAPPRYHPKERVLGLNANGVFKAYPYIELNRQAKRSFQDKINGQGYTIQWNPEHQAGRIFDADGHEMPVITGFWFAWFTFHPETRVFSAE